MTTPVLELTALSKRFTKPLDAAEKIANLFGAGRKPVTVHAVDAVSLSVGKGEIVGIVGESGCGKSTLGRMIAGILPPSSGSLKFHGIDCAGADKAQALKANLGVQMVFQDAMSSFNPRRRVVDILTDAALYHRIAPKSGAEDLAADVMRRVGLDPAMMWRFPHQFSGGQRARIGIARALTVNPEVMVCDESTAALDVSIQAQVINLFMKLRTELDLTYLFVSHDLSVVHHISDRIAVMYLGRVVELAPAREMFAAPNHPYTQALIAEAPQISTGKRQFRTIAGEIPSPLNPPKGCHFHPRCPFATDRCKSEAPVLKDIAPGRMSACHLNG